jgi:hypothetical protein
MKIDDVINSIASEFDITVIYTDDENRSFCTGKDVYIGKYDNKEYKLISFFHELGHILITQTFIQLCNYNTLLIEAECWNIGIKKALEKKIFFSDEAIQWGFQQILTYVGHDKRECSSWNDKYKPLLIITSQKQIDKYLAEAKKKNGKQQ